MARDKAANLSRLVIDTGTPLSAAGHRLEPTRPLGTLKEIQLHERQHGQVVEPPAQYMPDVVSHRDVALD